MKIVFMGTPDFAVPSLEILIENGFKPVAVVTGEDKARGRGRKIRMTPIKELAIEQGIPVLQPSSVKSDSFAKEVSDINPDLIIVVAFRILPEKVFGQAKLGSFNLHGSILPAFRGAAPINRAIMTGAEKTGLTTFFLEAKVDTGNIIGTCETEIGPDETAGEVHDRLKDMGAILVLETVQKIEKGEVEVSMQDDSLATPAPKIFRDDCRIPWEKSAAEVHNHIRGLSPRPTAFTDLDEVSYKIFKSALPTDFEDAEHEGPGHFFIDDDRLFVACGEGFVEILELQRPSKSRQAFKDFNMGFQLDRRCKFR